MHIDDLLKIASEHDASDLHIRAGAVPMMRVHGLLVPASDERLTPADTAAMAKAMLPEQFREQFERTQDVDFAYRIEGFGRFRCNLFQQRGTTALVMRLIPRGIETLEELLLPAVLGRIAEQERGLVLVTGISGSGKSTTLAAMVQYINEHRCANIVTIEDPIEYLHKDRMAIISQREVSVDTRSFAQALRSSLRQDPDVILVGEMRDQETIEIALTAAETGHLVLSTLHTLDATETINRIVSVFTPHHQQQIRLQLSSVLRAVISQRLIPRCDIEGRCPAVEVMVTTPYIRECIIDAAKTENIAAAIAAGTTPYGMQTFDQSIYELYKRRLVSYEEALRWASRVDEFKMRVEGVTADIEVPTEPDKTRSRSARDIIHFGR